MVHEISIVENIKRILALADTGLLYASSEYETERYHELKKLGLNMLHQLTLKPIEVLQNFYLPSKDYPTVKVDVRGLVLNDLNEVLLVKEHSDGLWSIPGGWADIGFSGAEAVIKEVREEAGIHVQATRLLSVFDNHKHAHPPQPYHIYKIVYLCSAKDFSLKKGFDILDVGFFNVKNLPPLSTNRIVEAQIKSLHERALNNIPEALFD